MPAMRALIAAVALLSLTPTTGLAAPGANGTIEGRVINAATDEPQRGVAVTLYRATAEGEDLVDTVVTRRDGRYSFGDLPTGDNNLYALDATFQEGLFPSRVLTLPRQSDPPPIVESTLRVWPTTTDPRAIFIRRDDKFVVPHENGVGILESVTIVNPSDLAYAGRGAEMGGSGDEPAPSLGFALPAAADCEGIAIRDSNLDVPSLLCTEYGFAITSAIPPGEHRITFSYEAEGSAGIVDLSHVALYTIGETSVYAADPLAVESNRLEARGNRTIGGRDYAVWGTDEDLDPGDRIQVQTIARSDLSPWVVLGGVAAGLALLMGVGYLIARRKRVRATVVASPVHPPETRDELLTAIAELDLRYRSGEIEEATWTRERAELRHRLERDRSTAAP